MFNKPFVFTIAIFIAFSCNRQEKENQELVIDNDCCSNIYFIPISKSEQPTQSFVDICNSFKKIDFAPVNSIYKFKKEPLLPPKGVDTTVWNESSYIRGIWSIEFSDSLNQIKKEVNFKLTEFLLSDEVIHQRKSRIPVAIFGSFFSSSRFFRLDSSVIYIQIENMDSKNLKNIVRDRIRERWLDEE